MYINSGRKGVESGEGHSFVFVCYKLIIKSRIALKNLTRTTECITTPAGNMH